MNIFKKSFPKNIVESILFTLILLASSTIVHAFFDYFFINQNEFVKISKSFFVYFCPFLLLSLLARKSLIDFKFLKIRTDIALSLVLFTLGLGFALNLPLFYFSSYLSGIQSIGLPSKINASSLVSLVLLAPIFEELMIKGILFDNLLKNNNLVKSAIVVTVAFVVLHFSLEKTPTLIIGSIFTCYVYFKTKNIFYPIIIHLINNTVSVFEYKLIVINTDYNYFELYGDKSIYILLFSYLLIVISGGYLYRKYQLQK